MVFPQVEAEEWATQYGITKRAATCAKCKKTYPLNMPVADKEMRGLMMEDHGCPKEYRYSSFRIFGEVEREIEDFLKR